MENYETYICQHCNGTGMRTEHEFCYACNGTGEIEILETEEQGENDEL